jgi:hypothetical protein
LGGLDQALLVLSQVPQQLQVTLRQGHLSDGARGGAQELLYGGRAAAVAVAALALLGCGRAGRPGASPRPALLQLQEVLQVISNGWPSSRDCLGPDA